MAPIQSNEQKTFRKLSYETRGFTPSLPFGELPSTCWEIINIYHWTAEIVTGVY